MLILPMVASHPENTGNFVGKTGKRKMWKGTFSRNFQNRGAGF